jgi:hypothetical protein
MNVVHAFGCLLTFTSYEKGKVLGVRVAGDELDNIYEQTSATVSVVQSQT